MFRLTREVRFGINPPAADGADDVQWDGPASNSYAGYPSLAGFGTYLTLRVTLRGELDATSQYLINIKRIDEAAREFVRDVVPVIRSGGPVRFLQQLSSDFFELWRERFESVSVGLSPFLNLEISFPDPKKVSPMMRLSQKFEFSASHRLHNPDLSDEENRKTFGKCNNPMGHGHNYELQVTLRTAPDGNGGLPVDLPTFERTVAETVIEKFDHKNLNAEVPEFRGLIPSVENIAMVIYRLLKPKFSSGRAALASVTVWETPKTWCEYSE